MRAAIAEKMQDYARMLILLMCIADHGDRSVEMSFMVSGRAKDDILDSVREDKQ